MEFKEVYSKFYPLLLRQAKYFTKHPNSVDHEDIIQEMLIHLWNGWKEGKWEGKTESYILQSLKFHLRNYLRKEKEKTHLVSLDELLDEEGTALKDVIPEILSSFPEVIENKMLIHQIRSNGLTRREREVFDLYLQECSLREIGKRLGLSHVRVFKIRQNIRRKWASKLK